MTFVDDAHLTYAQSLSWAVCFAMLLIGAASFSLLWAFHHTRSAEAARTPSKAALRKGPITLHGRVRTKDGFPAIKVRIEKAAWTSRDKAGRLEIFGWKEVSRTVTAHPFALELDNGTRVQVEPGTTPLLIDALVDRGGVTRKRYAQAELSHGERVCIEGVLTRREPYVAEAEAGPVRTSWVLRPLPTRPMVLATAFLAVHHERRARVWRAFGFSCVAVLLLSVALAGSYLPLMLAGATTDAVVTAHRRESSCGRHACPRWLVLRTASGEVMTEQVSAAVDARVSDDAQLQVVRIRRWPSVHQLGPRPTLPEETPLCCLALTLLPLAVGCMMHVRNIGWFTQKRVTHLHRAGEQY